MKLPEIAILEFKEIYKNTYGIDLDYETAEYYAVSLMKLMLLAQPIPYEKIRDAVHDERKEEKEYNNHVSKLNKQRQKG